LDQLAWLRPMMIWLATQAILGLYVQASLPAAYSSPTEAVRAAVQLEPYCAIQNDAHDLVFPGTLIADADGAELAPKNSDVAAVPAPVPVAEQETATTAASAEEVLVASTPAEEVLVASAPVAVVPVAATSVTAVDLDAIVSGAESVAERAALESVEAHLAAQAEARFIEMAAQNN